MCSPESVMKHSKEQACLAAAHVAHQSDFDNFIVRISADCRHRRNGLRWTRGFKA